jgi:N-acetylmuramoyl-L-alanine amidase
MLMKLRSFSAFSILFACVAAGPAGAAGNIVGVAATTPAAASEPAGTETQVKAIRLVGDGGRTRLIVDMSHETEFGLLRLRNPYRLVIDLPKTKFGFEPDPAEGRGLVEDYRYGLVGPGRARIVLDLKGPVNVVQSFMQPSGGGQPARIVLDLAPGTAEDFARAEARERQARLAIAGRKGDKLTRRPRSSMPVVVIDPGHGGIDTGAVASRDLVEKNLTLVFAEKLAKILNERGNVEAILTRTEDVFMSLGDRVKVARLNEAALFVSVHADIVPQAYVRGATVYTVSDEASDEMAAGMAERENRSDILAGLAIEDQPDEVADILFDLARRETKNLSIRFAKTLIRDIRPQLTLNKSPWRRAAFLVLKAPDVPSVLFELGYISNEQDQELLVSEEWRGKTTKAMADAIERFLVPAAAPSRSAERK